MTNIFFYCNLSKHLNIVICLLDSGSSNGGRERFGSLEKEDPMAAYLYPGPVVLHLTVIRTSAILDLYAHIPNGNF